ncbi:unnamed protein product, partial [Linum tenue]
MFKYVGDRGGVLVKLSSGPLFVKNVYFKKIIYKSGKYLCMSICTHYVC